MKILVTGYDPFSGSPTNPSGELALAMPTSMWGVDIVSAEIPTEYVAGRARFEQLLAQHQPDAIVGLGLHGGLSYYAVEQYGWNSGNAGGDNIGYDPRGLLDPAGVVAEDCTIPALQVKGWLDRTETGISSSISEDAGSYLCNAAMFFVGNFYRQRAEAPPPFVFIHVMGNAEAQGTLTGVSHYRPFMDMLLDVKSVVEGVALELLDGVRPADQPPAWYKSPADIRPVLANPPRSYWSTTASTSDTTSAYAFRYYGGVEGAPTRAQVLSWPKGPMDSGFWTTSNSAEVGRRIKLTVEQNATFVPLNYASGVGRGNPTMQLWHDNGFYDDATICVFYGRGSRWSSSKTTFHLEGTDTNGYEFHKKYELTWPSSTGRFVEVPV